MNRITKSESFRAAITLVAFAVIVFVLAALMVGCDNALESGSKGGQLWPTTTEELPTAPLDCITYDVPKSMTWVDDIRLVSDPRTNQRWWVLEDRHIKAYVVLPVEPTGDVG